MLSMSLHPFCMLYVRVSNTEKYSVYFYLTRKSLTANCWHATEAIVCFFDPGSRRKRFPDLLYQLKDTSIRLLSTLRGARKRRISGGYRRRVHVYLRCSVYREIRADKGITAVGPTTIVRPARGSNAVRPQAGHSVVSSSVGKKRVVPLSVSIISLLVC